MNPQSNPPPNRITDGDRTSTRYYERFHLNQFYNAVEDEQLYTDEYTNMLHSYNEFIVNGNTMFTRMEQALRANLDRSIVRQSFYYHRYSDIRRIRSPDEAIYNYTPVAAPAPAPAPVPAPVPASVKEGLNNPDQDSKMMIDNKLTSMNMGDSQSRFKLRDYYIKSAYNAFNPDKFKNSTVSMDACLYVIARGCRFIDFEVFSVDNVPVIASSSVNSFNYKETYNHIPVSEAFEVLGSYAFSSSKCPNPNDPFIIHMRIMSRNVTMYDNLAKVIAQSKTMARNLLGAKYGREYHSKDLGNEDVSSLAGKVILMVDGSNPVYRSTKLFELINMSSKSLFLSKYTFFGVKNVGDPQTFKDANKKNMCLVIPDKAGRPINDGHNGPFTWGCQIVAMCFQEEARDEKLKAYEDKFASVGYGLILKPEDLRYVPITIAPPAPPNPKSSMESRPAEAAGGFKFTI